jgi:hypothetical protein
LNIVLRSLRLEYAVTAAITQEKVGVAESKDETISANSETSFKIRQNYPLNKQRQNFQEELKYAKNYAGIAIIDKQFHRLKELINNLEIKSVLIFPLSGNPE